jgi:hypothetical protein
MNTYTYEIINLFTVDINPDRPNDVARVLTKITATNEAGSQQSMHCMFNMSPSDSFTAFEQLTDQEVRQWVDSSAQWPYYKKELDVMLAAVPVPQLVQQTLPWLPTPDQVLADYLAGNPDVATSSSSTSSVVTSTLDINNMGTNDEYFKRLIREVLAESSTSQE